MHRKHNRQPSTEKTIAELRKSIDSMEKMIEKSYRILNNTRNISHKQVRSDSVQLYLSSKGKKSNLSFLNHSKANSIQKINEEKTHDNLSLKTQLKTPQKTKPFKTNLRINTQQVNAEHQRKQEKILICDELSPVTMPKKNIFDSSFASGMDPAYIQRIKTEGFTDSWENSLDQSLEKNRTQEISDLDQKPLKKIVLKRKKNYQGENISQKKKIFNYALKKGKFSKGYTKQINQEQIKKCVGGDSRTGNYRLATLSSSRQSCQKHEKQNRKMGIEQFMRKVKQYGFVQRYLSYNQVLSIYQYLKKSDIPEYKWPLFVVDEVYEKMKTPKQNFH